MATSSVTFNRRLAESNMPDLCDVKTRQGATIFSAEPCSARPHDKTPQELELVGRTTATTLWKVSMGHGKTILPTYRLHYTFASGETALFHVIAALGPESNELARVLVCERVD